MAVSASDAAFFAREGYLVLPGFASADEVAALKSEGEALLAGCDPEANPSVFSTRRQTATTDEYFLQSGNNVSFFLEEGALDADGRLRVPKQLAVNKFGHGAQLAASQPRSAAALTRVAPRAALHDLTPAFRSFSRSPKMAALLRSVGMTRPTPVQSMYITKQPSLGGEVVPHQDSAFLTTTPQTCVGFWVALEAATRSNGCLWALPRSHGNGVARRFVLTPERATRWADAAGGCADSPSPPEFPRPVDERSGYVALEVPAGTAVLLHGACVHASAANTSSDSRHAYSVHFVEADAEWAKDNWMHRAPHFPPVPLGEEDKQ